MKFSYAVSLLIFLPNFYLSLIAQVNVEKERSASAQELKDSAPSPAGYFNDTDNVPLAMMTGEEEEIAAELEKIVQKNDAKTSVVNKQTTSPTGTLLGSTGGAPPLQSSSSNTPLPSLQKRTKVELPIVEGGETSSDDLDLQELLTSSLEKVIEQNGSANVLNNRAASFEEIKKELKQKYGFQESDFEDAAIERMISEILDRQYRLQFVAAQLAKNKTLEKSNAASPQEASKISLEEEAREAWSNALQKNSIAQQSWNYTQKRCTDASSNWVANLPEIEATIRGTLIYAEQASNAWQEAGIAQQKAVQAHIKSTSPPNILTSEISEAQAKQKEWEKKAIQAQEAMLDIRKPDVIHAKNEFASRQSDWENFSRTTRAFIEAPSKEHALAVKAATSTPSFTDIKAHFSNTPPPLVNAHDENPITIIKDIIIGATVYGTTASNFVAEAYRITPEMRSSPMYSFMNLATSMSEYFIADMVSKIESFDQERTAKTAELKENLIWSSDVAWSLSVSKDADDFLRAVAAWKNISGKENTSQTKKSPLGETKKPDDLLREAYEKSKIAAEAWGHATALPSRTGFSWLRGAFQVESAFIGAASCARTAEDSWNSAIIARRRELQQEIERSGRNDDVRYISTPDLEKAFQERDLWKKRAVLAEYYGNMLKNPKVVEAKDTLLRTKIAWHSFSEASYIFIAEPTLENCKTALEAARVAGEIKLSANALSLENGFGWIAEGAVHVAWTYPELTMAAEDVASLLESDGNRGWIMSSSQRRINSFQQAADATKETIWAEETSWSLEVVRQTDNFIKAVDVWKKEKAAAENERRARKDKKCIVS